MAPFTAGKLSRITLLLAAVLLFAVFALDGAAGRGFDLWLIDVVPIGLVSVVFFIGIACNSVSGAGPVSDSQLLPSND
mgnify:CR=1 FL=1